ncbi:MAG: DoxX family protein [Alphaproteobacteria bacterium]|nr:DoxX family protein [Alphaproteobacteria bacterium]
MLRGLYNCYNRVELIWPWLQDLVLLVQRLLIGKVFFVSGLTKIDDWSNTLSLFQDEYKVPFMPPGLSAYSATTFELICPVLLALGLGTRFVALPLIGITAVIQLTYDQNPQHYLWAALLFGLVCFGSGRFSLDFLVTKHLRRVYGRAEECSVGT